TSLPTSRSGDSATLLLDGTVLLVGPAGSLVFNPSSPGWTPVPNAPTVAGGNQAVRLLDGRVLVAGGVGSNLAYIFTGPANSLVPVLTMNITAPDALPVVNGTYTQNPFTVTATIANTGAAVAQQIDV